MDFDGEATALLFRDRAGQFRKRFYSRAAKTASMRFIGKIRLDESGGSRHRDAVQKYLDEARDHVRAGEFCALIDQFIADEIVQESGWLSHHGADHPGRESSLRIEMVIGGQNGAAN